MAAMAKIGFHLHHHLQLQLPFSIPPPNAFSLLQIQNPLRHFHSCTVSTRSRCCLHRSRRFDSNAESFNLDDNDGDESTSEQWLEALEDYIDSIWIFKVFRSYGWMLPGIIISMLLTTGLKAFLLALAVPIGQSTFAFAIRRYQNRGKINTNTKTKRKVNRKRSTPYNGSRIFKFKDKQEQSVKQEVRKKNNGYKSWGSENVASVRRSSPSVSNFGGWDELDELVQESNVESARRTPTK
ncbi:uncharacterized protein LOC127266551 [Andrographis paniculata]|uniref:uncharacterized protein LOC127266551 n=1 Tax=Andrographis paniculata TaxID=175694 RepID=UPI0021E6FB12|nr:uncharacterized protein LOC127266551 [Andrographis paniculata]